ncbi:unnamed protein product [Pleuronectes platessa]|uniref:Uncharacterized protein n=1 Tax=Pleuronectes platessa TaxID=8262 RepID=A0A9N7VN41_PLEPL|nr:unnamed protein product [Pleuronectes platessa]
MKKKQLCESHQISSQSTSTALSALPTPLLTLYQIKRRQVFQDISLQGLQYIHDAGEERNRCTEVNKYTNARGYLRASARKFNVCLYVTPEKRQRRQTSGKEPRVIN